LNNDDVEIVAINDLTDNATLAHLLKYDTAFGPLGHDVKVEGDYLVVDGKKILALEERDPSKLPWKGLGVDIVLECTGVFRTRAKASLHLTAGAQKVLVSAPVTSSEEGDVQTIVLGVNDNEINPDETIFSNASCTTNCLAPVVKLLDENFEIISGSMSTIHAYTADQNLQDAPHSDLRRARAAAENIIPTSTGAAKAVSKVYPAIGDRIMAVAFRVPTITGSIIDLTVRVKNPASAEDVNKIFAEAAEGVMKGVLKYETDPIVSSDIVGSPYSSIFKDEFSNSRAHHCVRPWRMA